MSEIDRNELERLNNKITNYIPKELMTPVWEGYKKITGSREPQPCSCPSSGKLWKKAMDTIRDYVNKGE